MPRPDLPELIAGVSDKLTPTERRLAEAVTKDPTLLAFGTVSDLASRVGTSGPSVVRFANKLGFDGYTALQEHVRRSVHHQLTRPRDRIRREETNSVLPERADLENAIKAVFDTLDGERLTVLGDPIVRAHAVWVISGETSLAGAHTLVSGLTMIRPGVHLVDDHSMGRDISQATAEDVAVVFDFHRYRKSSITAARLLSEAGVPIIAITDGPLSPLASLTPTWCGLVVPAVGPFDSSIPAVAAAELLIAYVAHELHDRALERIDRTEDMWELTETYHPEA